MHIFTWFNLIPFVKNYATEEYIHVVIATFITIICVIFSLYMYSMLRRIKNPEVPDPKFSLRTFIELIAGLLLSIGTEIMGDKNAKKFFPVIASIFLFIFMSNAIGLIPGFLPPTDNINTTLSCGIFVFVYYNYVGFKEHGVSYMKHFMGPVLWLSPLMLPIELISNAVRPLSLGLRLFGNITGDHLVLSIFSKLAPIGVPIPFMALGLFISFFQAFIFVILSMIYLTLALAHEEH